MVATPWHTQNFLRHPSRIERLLDLTNLQPHDLVLDLGAGRGELTTHLARRCRGVVAVEKDPLLVAGLRLRFADASNVSVREADALAVRLPREPYKVIANIPFDITTRLVRRLTSAAYAPLDSYLAIQAEAAARVLGQPRASLFSALVKPWFDARIVHRFQRYDFAPPPRVEVVFLRLHKRGPPLVAEGDAMFYRDLLTYCFSSARPTLKATLAPLVGARRFQHLGLAPAATPASLQLSDWLAIVQALSGDEFLRKRVHSYAMLDTSRYRAQFSATRSRTSSTGTSSHSVTRR